jgi:hypothetical protein
MKRYRRRLPKFPCTPHLAGSCGTPDDLYCGDAVTAAVLSQTVTVQEKLDGINIGFWLQAGRYRAVAKARQVSLDAVIGLPGMAKATETLLRRLDPILLQGLAVFGEYVPDADFGEIPWLAMDICNSSGRFLSTSRVADLCTQANVPTVPLLFTGRLLAPSRLKQLSDVRGVGGGRVEGVYVRQDRSGFLRARYKFVRPDFTKRQFVFGGRVW